MTTFDDLQTLIAEANTSVTALNGILNQLQTELPNQSLLPGGTPEVTQEAVDYEKAIDGTITFILKQTTPNTEDSKYKGVYRLPLAATNSRLKAVTLVSPIDPDDITAQLRDPVSETNPNPDFGTAQPITALEDQCFNAITLLSVGAFELRLELEDSCGEWCCEFDFTASDGGWVEFIIGASGANYTSDVGWTQKTDGTITGAYIQYPLSAATVFTSIEMTYDEEEVAGRVVLYGQLSGSYNILLNDPASGGTHIVSWSGSATLDNVGLQSGNTNTGEGGLSTISHAKFRGTGENPFGTDNC